MKKLIAMLLCLAMVAAVFAGCDGNNENPEQTTTAPTQTDTPTTVPTTVTPVVDAEPIEYTPLYYWSFDDGSNLTAVEQVTKAADSINDGATYDIGESAHEVMITETGVVGNALYLDGTYGVKLNLDGLNITDGSYTVSFWLNATRLSTYGPTLQIGRNMGDLADLTNDPDTYRCVTWLNFTQAEWGTNSAKLFPVYWNRNSDFNVWPWGALYDDAVHGKQEWLLITLVVDGNDYVCADDGLPRVGTKYYLNGELAFDASAELAYYQGVSPEILTGDGIEGYLGVNYWDTIFKGYFDELYIFDEPLTAGQVKSLYQMGDTTVEPVAPEGGDTTPEPTLPEITADANAIDVLGNTARELGWWSDNTGTYELADGKTLTIKLNNYSNAEANYKNFVLGLCNVALTTDQVAGTGADASYAEYIVIRPDAWGWTPTANPYGTYTPDWSDWAAWLNLMKDAEVTITMTRNGTGISGTMTFVGADGTTMTETYEALDIMAADAPCHVFIGGEGAYIELLSVE